MSAYICNPEHFGILAAYAAAHDCALYDWKNVDKRITAQNVAKNLALENIRSVAYRYPNDKDGERPGPCLKDAQIVEAAAIYAAYFVDHPQAIRPMQIIKLCDCVDYQSCETPDWITTKAWRQLEWLKSAALHNMPEYNTGQWLFDKTIPAIEALYSESV